MRGCGTGLPSRGHGYSMVKAGAEGMFLENLDACIQQGGQQRAGIKLGDPVVESEIMVC